MFLLAVEQKLVSVGWLGLPKSWASALALPWAEPNFWWQLWARKMEFGGKWRHAKAKWDEGQPVPLMWKGRKRQRYGQKGNVRPQCAFPILAWDWSQKPKGNARRNRTKNAFCMVITGRCLLQRLVSHNPHLPVNVEMKMVSAVCPHSAFHCVHIN